LASISFDRNIRIVRAPRRAYVTRMATNAILSEEETMPRTNPHKPQPRWPFKSNARRWEAVAARDAAHDGAFVFAVSSTGVFCRPSCPAKRPRRENVSFFDTPSKPNNPAIAPACAAVPRRWTETRNPRWFAAMCRYIEQHLEDRLTLAMLAKNSAAARSTCSALSNPRWESRPRPTSTLAAFARSNKISRPDTT
jgi:hypothetical protein